MKRILSLFICIILIVSLCACTIRDEDIFEHEPVVGETLFEQFTVVEVKSDSRYGKLAIMYDVDSLALYYMEISTLCDRFTITPIYDSDGKVKMYTEED